MTVNLDPGRFADEGYVVLPDLLAPDEARSLWSAFDGLDRSADDGRPVLKWHERQLLAADPLFLDAITRPRLLDAVRVAVGDDVQLLALDALETPASSGSERSWHADFAFFADAVLTVNCAIYLQDMTPERGPLLVVPGSHRRHREPDAAEEHARLADEIEVEVGAGTAVVFNAMLWHSGGRNQTGDARRAVFPYFGHYWIKRMDEFYRDPLPAYVLEHTDPTVRQLFGLGLAVASVHGGYDERSYG